MNTNNTVMPTIRASYKSEPEIELILKEEMQPAEKAIVEPLRASQGHIQDSGNRRKFESGAVRDIQEGKGRCDLMPLDVVAHCYKYLDESKNVGEIFESLDNFVKSGDIEYLYEILDEDTPYEDYDTMFLEVAKHFEDGATKYGERNWQKGIPVHCYIDSAIRHYLKYLREDTDEPHDRAFVWNIMCAIWTCINKPELNEYRKVEG